MFPFTSEVLSSLIEHYNRAVWPAPIVTYALALALVGLALRPLRGHGRGAAHRLVAAVLAAAWGWTGVAFQLVEFATINFMAPVYGGLFIVQALLLGWSAVVGGGDTLQLRFDPAGWLGLALAAYAIVGYPLIAATAGEGWQTTRIVGLAPGPTAVFTLAVLLLTAGRAPLRLAVVPVLWSLIGGVTAWELGVAEDRALPLIGVGGLAAMVWKNRRSDGQ